MSPAQRRNRLAPVRGGAGAPERRRCDVAIAVTPTVAEELVTKRRSTGPVTGEARHRHASTRLQSPCSAGCPVQSGASAVGGCRRPSRDAQLGGHRSLAGVTLSVSGRAISIPKEFLEQGKQSLWQIPLPTGLATSISKFELTITAPNWPVTDFAVVGEPIRDLHLALLDLDR